jgi:hypothetical protein
VSEGGQYDVFWLPLCPWVSHFAPWTLCRYNKEFVEACNRMDEIWVPSLFSQRVLSASGQIWLIHNCLIHKDCCNPPLISYLHLLLNALQFRRRQRIVNTNRPYCCKHDSLQPRDYPASASSVWPDGLWGAAKVQAPRLASQTSPSSQASRKYNFYKEFKNSCQETKVR